MNYRTFKRILLNSIIGAILINCHLYSQECDPGYDYFAELPSNVTNIDNEENCFSDDDVSVLNDLIYFNTLHSYSSHFELGLQTWVTGKLVTWVATYIPSGENGITEKINQLPENIGQLSELSNLYIEKHDLTELPNSFTLLSNLSVLAISNNWLSELPEEFGSLINLETLDLGYNQIVSIPESIGALENIEYFFLFNNQISSLPESICNLDLDWDGIDPVFNYPYFACGGNYLCDSELIPDCVENSENFNISMEQNYYSFLLDTPQCCLGDVNFDGGWNVLDIVTLANCVLSQSCADFGCAGDVNDDGAWNVLDIVTLANCVLSQNCDDI